MEPLLLAVAAVVIVIAGIRLYYAWLDRSSRRAVDELERRHRDGSADEGR